MSAVAYLVLGNSSSKNNLGTLIRCGAAFAVEEVIVVGASKWSTHGAHGSHKVRHPQARQAILCYHFIPSATLPWWCAIPCPAVLSASRRSTVCYCELWKYGKHWLLVCGVATMCTFGTKHIHASYSSCSIISTGTTCIFSSHVFGSCSCWSTVGNTAVAGGGQCHSNVSAAFFPSLPWDGLWFDHYLRKHVVRVF